MTLNDDFFDFGGHSLLATRIIGKLQNRHGIECRFNDFFESPSAAALAKEGANKSLI
ncbi:acyl carrier protein [Aeromonas salmonicida]|nr:acyl carrier protein [Aeromonas salmonicida]